MVHDHIANNFSVKPKQNIIEVFLFESSGILGSSVADLEPEFSDTVDSDPLINKLTQQNF